MKWQQNTDSSHIESFNDVNVGLFNLNIKIPTHCERDTLLTNSSQIVTILIIGEENKEIAFFVLLQQY